MPTAVANCLKPKFTLVTSSAAIAMIARPQWRTRHLKMSNIRQVRFFLKSHSTKIGNYYCRSKRWTFLQQRIKFNVKKAVVKILQGSVVTQTMLGGLTISPGCQFSLVCVCVPKIMKSG